MRNRQPIPELTELQVQCFWALVHKLGPDDCWLWHGGVTKAANSQDYGIWHVNGSSKHLRPHRVAYTLLIGPIPAGLDIDHVHGKCTSSLCCNPAHLEPVTTGENVRRYYLARTHCRRGHKIVEHGRPCATCRTFGKRRERFRNGEMQPDSPLYRDVLHAELTEKYKLQPETPPLARSEAR